jgi:MFS family permease
VLKHGEPEVSVEHGGFQTVGDVGDAVGKRRMTAAAPADQAGPLSAPLLVTGFRVLAVVQFSANIGIWVHTVAAQWLLTTTGASSTLTALVQTALTLPFFVLALPAGLLADVVDRRRMLMLSMAAMAVTLLGLTIVAAGSLLPPAALVPATLVLGAANVLSVIAWQSLIPELVDRRTLPAAATIDGMSFNAARAAGPAAGGLLLSLVGPAWVFGFDTVVFTMASVGCWLFAPRMPRREPASSPVGAFVDGVRFVRHSSWMRRLLLRLTLFSFPASCLWALLPVVSHQRLGLGAVGFGVLFGAVGVGAVLGPVVVQPVRRRLGRNAFITVGSVAYALGLAVVAEARRPLVIGVFLLAVGASWVSVQTTWMAATQAVLPPWVRARALACVLLVHQGCQAFGAVVWGVLADHLGLSGSILLAAVAMALGAATVRGWGLRPSAGIEPVPVSLWSQPGPAPHVDPREGPVLVLVEYDVRADRCDEFLRAMAKLAGSRRRLGARRWRVYRDAARPHVLVEAYVVRSWGQHVHQESVRWTTAEKRIRDAVEALAERPAVVRRLVVTEPSAAD